jgi:hypothetical protein
MAFACKTIRCVLVAGLLAADLAGAQAAAAKAAAADSTRQVLADFGFFGRWSPDCDQAPSPDNSLRTTFVTRSGAVGFKEQFGAGYRDNLYQVLAASRTADDQVSIRVRLNGEITQDLVMAMDNGRLRIMENRPPAGKTAGPAVVENGVITASGAPTPWMSRCR